MKRVAVVGIPGGWSTGRMLDALEEKTGNRILVDMAEVRLDLESRKAWCGDLELTALDAIVVKKIAPLYSPDALDRMEIIRFIAGQGVPVFSNPDTMHQLIDRLSCTRVLRQGGIPMPPTVVTESVEEAAATVERYGRAVFKPLYGSKARGMAVVEHGPGVVEDIRAFKGRGNRVMYIQKMVSHAGGRLDLGVSFLDGKYLATYARQGGGGAWDTTIRNGGRYAPFEPSPKIRELADRAQALFPGMAFTCVDVVETPEEAEVFEVSAFGGFRGLLEALNIDVAALYADHVLERIA